MGDKEIKEMDDDNHEEENEEENDEKKVIFTFLIVISPSKGRALSKYFADSGHF